MKVAVFQSQRFGAAQIEELGTDAHEFRFIEASLSLETMHLATGCEVVCCCPFLGRQRDVLIGLARMNIRYLVLGNEPLEEWDLPLARRLGLEVVKIPARSPLAVAEHAIKLMEALMARQSGNGTASHSLTVGLIGMGQVGRISAQILHSMGLSLLSWDKDEDQDFGREQGLYYADWDIILRRAGTLMVHIPLYGTTRTVIDAYSLKRLAPGSLLINTGRPEILDLEAIIAALDEGHLGGFAWDLYPRERVCSDAKYLFRGVDPELVQALREHPRAVVTERQAKLNERAPWHRAWTTLYLLQRWSHGVTGEYERIPL